jgi:hypothetical protein
MGAAYDTFNNVLLIFRSGNIWAFNGTNWIKPAVPGDAPGDGDQSYGRFRFDPVNNGAWYHGWANGQHTTWFYRYQVNGTPPSPSVSIVINPPTLASGDPITVTWAASNATDCTKSGSWSSGTETTGSALFNIGANSATFNISCNGPGGPPADRTVTITDVGIGGGGSLTVSNPNPEEGGGGGGGSPHVAFLLVLLLSSAIRIQKQRP